ncbi:hypothetical protein PIROE2DRAFT_3673 [Piromyces sp. E2]|nr:hypothetical protein PIROE2DRAFT_3673 [Piromyces sp. E2]|eukprot:OUM68540.1 hypothetical protein PIROE2DRAFT_3673 [Piromyces sp. E2]
MEITTKNSLPKDNNNNINKSNEKINLNLMNNKNKSFNEKIKKANSKKNVKKRYNNPFPISNLKISNTINKNNTLNGKRDSRFIQNQNSKSKILINKLVNYYINEFFPDSLKHYFSPIKVELMLLNNNNNNNCIYEDKTNINLKNNISCIVVSNKSSIKTCWNNGFFGKGNLSRSEPNWTERILKDIYKKHSGINNDNFENNINGNNHISSKSIVNKSNSYLFIDKLIETKNSALKLNKNEQWNGQLLNKYANLGFSLIQCLIQDIANLLTIPINFGNDIIRKIEHYLLKSKKQKLMISDLKNIEYMQLDLQEAFFLKYALNCISIKDEKKVLTIDDCWRIFRNDINNPSDQFILKYVAYHYYRSQGWIVKEGLKYGVDYGPAFSHSEYAISIIPVMNNQDKKINYVENMPSIHEINCTNRVCNQVLKKLVYCYIIIPEHVNLDSVDCLKEYSIYEIRMKRWNPDKTRN